MVVLGSSALAGGQIGASIDHDPQVVSTNAPIGSLFIDGNGNYFIKKDNGDTVNVEQLGGGLPIFYEESDGNSSTTGTGLTQKVKLTFTAEAADYLISYSAEGFSADSGTRVEMQLEQDDTTTLASVDNITTLQGIGEPITLT